MALMDDAPYEFIVHHQKSLISKIFLHFKHRTFNATDLYYFISFLQFHYSQHKKVGRGFLFDRHIINAIVSSIFEIIFFR